MIFEVRKKGKEGKWLRISCENEAKDPCL